MIMVFILILVFMVILFIFSRGRYNGLLQLISTKEYPLKRLIPGYLYVLDKLNYRYDSKYDRKLLQSIVQLHGRRNARKFLAIHWANKLSTIMISLLIIFLVGIGIGEIEKNHILLAIIVEATLIYGTDKDLMNRIKKKQLLIRLDFPDFINKLTLLIDAGMNVSSAWSKLTLENVSNRPLYKELKVVVQEINSGKSEREAFENFAKRCRTPEITKFVSVILQNLKKGNNELTSILRVQANECWEMRKDTAKQLGEEASTKLLIPIAIMFISILIITVAPALLQLRGF
ncbi:MAG: type II secretion system F family protein [Firmicutes bacterium]|nr:type II secretion system F family protein [Bacillota bacterium]